MIILQSAHSAINEATLQALYVLMVIKRRSHVVLVVSHYDCSISDDINYAVTKYSQCDKRIENLFSHDTSSAKTNIVSFWTEY